MGKMARAVLKARYIRENNQGIFDTKLKRYKKDVNIEITKLTDGRYFAQYLNQADRLKNGIGQFGKTAFEAEINLQAFLNKLDKETLKTNIYSTGTE